MNIKVAIADDQGMIRAGLRSLLSGERDIDVVAEAADGEQAVAAVRLQRPDVVLMDIRMPRIDGIEATRQIVADRLPTRVLVLTTFDLDEYVFGALRAGAGGFLLKDASPEELVDAVHTLARGDALLSPRITRRLIEAFATTAQPDHAQHAALGALTAREGDVLRLLGRGLSNAEIADALVVTPGTVKTHVSNIFLKLDLRDRAQAVVFAYESGLVRPGGPTR